MKKYEQQFEICLYAMKITYYKETNNISKHASIEVYYCSGVA
jgi:hypothetical protein